MRTYGKLELTADNQWAITADAYTMAKLKRLFPRIKKREFGTVHLHNTPDICRDLEWFFSRYPMESGFDSFNALTGGSRAQQARLETLEKFLHPDYRPEPIPLALPLRDYQLQAAHLLRTNGFLLLGDSVGLGKSASAIGAVADPTMMPVLIVCQTHLVRQWSVEQLPKFLPGVTTHVIKQKRLYPLPAVDFYLITYSKLAAWADYFEELKLKAVIYDEIQELRLPESAKYQAALRMTEFIPYRMGLSATPVFNFGNELYSVVKILNSEVLGDKDEFEREWCYQHGTHTLIKDPKAFGTFLRDNFIMLVRSRKEVGRELPPITRVTHVIPHDEKALEDIKESALVLARRILEGTFVEKGQASREFDMKLRQATGIAKAPHAADFIRMMIKQGQKVLAFAWHREVYSVLLHKLSDFRPVLYTGSESPAAKARAKEAFMRPFAEGGSDVMFMSLRSAAGLDGLQDVADLVVFVELDWSPGVMEQCTGRLARDRTDGTFNKVMEIFLLSDSGADPVIVDLLGLKSTQSTGIMQPNDEPIEEKEVDPDRIKRLATEYLKMHGQQASAS